MTEVRKIRKSLIAAGGAAVCALGGVMLDGNLTVPEAIASAGAGLVFGFAAWRVPNAAQ